MDLIVAPIDESNNGWQRGHCKVYNNNKNGVEGIQNKRQPMLELRSFSHKIKSRGEAEATKAECFEITVMALKEFKTRGSLC